MTEASDPSLVTIGIATKNRWEDLKNTLSKIEEFGRGRLKVLIFDDASEIACPFDVGSICRGAELKRFSESEGYIVRRNQLAREMCSKYYLSLDDDSFPHSGSLEAALEFAQSCEDMLCLSFPIYNPIVEAHQLKSLDNRPYRVRSFVGCSHLLHRERFLALGGYCEDLVHFWEETELAARGFQRGLYCYHFPGLLIHHLESNAGRNRHRMDFYGARNNVLWNDWFMPSGLRLVKQSRSFVSRLLLVITTRRVGHLQGQIAGMIDVSRYKAKRSPMPPELYKEWKSLPSS
ncbi:MAG TPA: glycosyltransferase [Blastocatellia bacterium]|nr:glycosyltransferase [Blastocatellia bacterium]